jgi:hypothetical protein
MGATHNGRLIEARKPAPGIVLLAGDLRPRASSPSISWPASAPMSGREPIRPALSRSS